MSKAEEQRLCDEAWALLDNIERIINFIVEDIKSKKAAGIIVAK